LQLAKTEVSDDAKRLGAGGGLLAAGALLGLYAFGMLLNAVVEMLEEVMPDWLAALTLSIALGVLGGALAMAGQKRIKNVDIVPRETLASLREDVEVVDPRG
jgi:Mg2+/citrate symporter